MLETGNACCVCGEVRATLWRMAHDNLLGGTNLYQAVRCVGCGTARLDPRPDADAMAQHYAPATYARAEGEEETEVGKRLETYAARAADHADSLIPACENSPRRALDVGCGDGRFLRALQNRGWIVEGTETDAVAAQLAAKRLNAPVHAASLEHLTDLPDKSFDLISLLHVLEHLPNPRASLTVCRRLLKPGGAVLMHLPNAGSGEAALFGSSWYHLDLPRHFWGFTPHSLRRLLAETRFETVQFRYLPGLFILQSLRNALRGSTKSGANPAVRGGGGRLQTWLFLALLSVSSLLGRLLPGEILIATARHPDAR